MEAGVCCLPCYLCQALTCVFFGEGTVCLPPVWLYFDPELKHCQAACPKERMLLMLVDGHDDDFIVLPRGGADVLPMPALLPKDRQNAGKLLAATQSVLFALWLLRTRAACE